MPAYNEEHMAIFKQGVEAWHRWRKQTGAKPNLHNARSFCGKLTNVNLSDVKLFGVDFQNNKLCGADLRRANLGKARFFYDDLSGANLSGAYFSFTAFIGVNVQGADFTDALMENSVFVDCDFSDAKGLQRVRHRAPSSIGVDTIYKSKGSIPESFLRGCGVPENLIRDIPSLLDSEEAIQSYSCFISYSSKDAEFAKRLHGRMQDARLRVWFAPEDIQGGRKLHEQIETAIRAYDKLLIVLSEASLKSEWVTTELRKARKAERQSGKRKLFPMRLANMSTLQAWECIDPDTGEDLALELRQYFIPDFSTWKNDDQFEATFSRLVQDLRSGNCAA